jgi:flagellar hook-associated protein 3 FlgL
MRITNNAGFMRYQNNLEDVQTNKYKNEIRLDSGKKNVSISDAPKDVVNGKIISDKLNRNAKYKNNISEAFTEMQAVNDKLESLQDKIADIRQKAIDSTQTGNMGNLDSLAVDLKGYLQDYIRDANADHKGKFLFSGTKTNPDSLNGSQNDENNYPFELVEGSPTADNPSGLSVIFKGDFSDREINKDDATTEVINVKADEIFGKGGTEAFQTIIDLYNTMAYKEDGVKRVKNDVYTKTDTAKIDAAQKKLADFSDTISKMNSINGSRTNRLNSLKDQMTEEDTRLKSLRSNYEDTNYAQTTMDLMKDKSALDYSLSVGSQLMSKTLLDFLR